MRYLAFSAGVYVGICIAAIGSVVFAEWLAAKKMGVWP